MTFDRPFPDWLLAVTTLAVIVSIALTPWQAGCKHLELSHALYEGCYSDSQRLREVVCLAPWDTSRRKSARIHPGSSLDPCSGAWSWASPPWIQLALESLPWIEL